MFRYYCPQQLKFEHNENRLGFAFLSLAAPNKDMPAKQESLPDWLDRLLRSPLACDPKFHFTSSDFTTLILKLYSLLRSLGSRT